MTTRTVLMALALLAVPALAAADSELVVPPPAPSAGLQLAPAPGEEGGLYGGVYGGTGWTGGSPEAEAPGPDVRLDFDTGWIAGGALGYRFGGETVEPRAEVDFSFRADPSGTAGDAAGGPSAVTGMANLWVDMPVTTRLRPYAGGGLGAAHLSDDPGGAAGGADTVFAWQLGAGLAYQFTPRVEARADYRWFNTDEPGFEDEAEPDADYGTHNALLGLRFLF